VLVVGKAAELDLLPFAVVDDGTNDRAPVHGLIAGLRAARHEVVVALPVDVPRDARGALRALGDARAVPSGASRPRAPIRGRFLPVLESRVAAGELSLRGVNPRTLEIPASLPVDVDTPAALAELERLA
jgi:hypothetical protein